MTVVRRLRWLLLLPLLLLVLLLCSLCPFPCSFFVLRQHLVHLYHLVHLIIHHAGLLGEA